MREELRMCLQAGNQLCSWPYMLDQWKGGMWFAVLKLLGWKGTIFCVVYLEHALPHSGDGGT